MMVSWTWRDQQQEKEEDIFEYKKIYRQITHTVLGNIKEMQYENLSKFENVAFIFPSSLILLIYRFTIPVSSILLPMK